MFRKYGDTDFITGLRAYAALAVVVRHTAAFAAFGDIGLNLSKSGDNGVVMFFVIAGFSVATSYRQIGAFGPYLLRRLIRIWPVYVIAIITVWLALRAGALGSTASATQYGGSLDAYNLFMHATFLSFLDYRIANSIIGVEWTIPVEVFWYVVIPLVMTRWSLLATTVVCLLLFIGLRAAFAYAGFEQSYNMTYWMPFSHAPFFLAGVLAFQIRTNSELWPSINRTAAARYVPLTAVLVICAMAATPTAPGFKSYVIGLATFGLIAFHRPRQGCVGWLLENRLALLLGTISYSLYLAHMPITVLLSIHNPTLTGLPLFACVVAISVLVAGIMYLLIEQPTNTFGRWLTGRSTSPTRRRGVFNGQVDLLATTPGVTFQRANDVQGRRATAQ
jgi:exopolysaccharide production protein ExoZ